MQIRVDPQLCEAHGLCVELAPQVFELGDDDLASCTPTIPPSHQDGVRAAIAACPRQAINQIQEGSPS